MVVVQGAVIQGHLCVCVCEYGVGGGGGWEGLKARGELSWGKFHGSNCPGAIV